MSDMPTELSVSQADFEQITSIVVAEFQIEESILEGNVPTYYLKQPQETKQPFLRLLKNLEKLNLIAILRRKEQRIVLKIISKPSVKPSRVLINWLLFFATVATTFATGYLLSPEMIDPLVSGAAFSIAIMSVLGAHEMGHKLAANKRGAEASPPYFIPGPPPISGFFGIGTFGAVILQKSLPRNKDALFDIGSSGPVIGFAICVVVTIVGLALSPTVYRLPEGPFSPLPLLFDWMARALSYLGVFGAGNVFLIHPVALAGLIGMIVTVWNLLPAGMLDGGHIASSIFGDTIVKSILNIGSIIYLVLTGYYPMAIYVLFLSLFRHPPPLDNVSSLSASRKLVIPVFLIIFLLCGFFVSYPSYSIRVESNVQGVNFRIYYADSKYYGDSAPWERVLAEGNYIISVDSNFTANGVTYTFQQWEDGNENPMRMIVLNASMTIVANYTRVVTPTV